MTPNEGFIGYVCIILKKLNEYISHLCCLITLLICAVVFYEVIVRYFFNSPTSWSNELAQMLFVIMSCLVGFCLTHDNTHIRVDIFYDMFSDKGKLIVDIITFPIFLLFLGSIAYCGSEFAIDSINKMEHSSSVWGPPIYPVKLFIPLAAFLMIIQYATNILVAMKRLKADKKTSSLDR